MKSSSQYFRASVISRKTLAAICLYGLLTMAWLMPIMTGGADAGAGNALRQIIYLTIFGTSLVAIQAFKHPLRIIRIPIGVLFALGFCWLSVTWSIDSDNSLRRLLLTTMVLLSIFMLVRITGYKLAVQIHLRLMLLLLGVSYAVVVIAPGLGVHQSNEATAEEIIGAWRGIFGHKNVAGPAMSIIILTTLFAPFRQRKWIALLTIVAATFFLYKTQSKTSASLVAVAASMGYLVGILRPKYSALSIVSFLGTIFALIAAAWLNWSVISSHFLQEDSLTGRGSIWIALTAFWQDHFWGTGFGAFWNISGYQPIVQYVSERSFVTGQASGHSGYLDLLVTIGPVGLILVLVGLGIAPLCQLLSDQSITARRRALLAGIILYALMANFTETSVFDRDHPVNVTLLMAVALVPVAGGSREPMPNPSPPQILTQRRFRTIAKRTSRSSTQSTAQREQGV
ncbi:O-antigen ligase family protein [Rhizobium sp.]|uniref:O-antigen ligase family protein n=1 Tax=Rhizobium sp. TaxID=391 RepID=UPI0028B23B2C